MNKNKTLHAIGYCRVSTALPVREGLSLEVQENKLRQHAALYGLELVPRLSLIVIQWVQGGGLDGVPLTKGLAAGQRPALYALHGGRCRAR